MVWHIVWDVLIIQAMGCPPTITKLVTRHPNSRTYGAMKLHLVLLCPGRFHHIIPHSSMGKRALSWQMASTTQPMLAPPPTSIPVSCARESPVHYQHYREEDMIMSLPSQIHRAQRSSMTRRAHQWTAGMLSNRATAPQSGELIGCHLLASGASVAPPHAS
jgi:hypothetical protein